ncbi:polycystic kidney disease protein 1-like 2 [Scyliorhinus canicula]|uniref:polycystic kidney disease protein 1-like 2 n=1 Tax=Scyliorhinus canicula TaxID=7830 RepID=UPI0018F310DD|nr:polycystic kidney disease protein 1-like 2 [Scyliorhinus canicula]
MDVTICSCPIVFRLSLQLFIVSYSVFHVEAMSCLEHQVEFQNLCYAFMDQQLNFKDAQKECERGGGNLAVIQDEKMYKFLQDQLPIDKKWWIGFIVLAKKSSRGFHVPVLSWLDGSERLPSDGISKQGASFSSNCGYISWRSRYQQWATISCSKTSPFICEFGLQPSQGATSSRLNIDTISAQRPHYIPSKTICSVDTGDGHMVNTEVPDQSVRILHTYRGPGLIRIHVECQTKNGYLEAEKTVFIEEPPGDFSGTQCSISDQSDVLPSCRARYGQTLSIQVVGGKAANLIYTASIGNKTVPTSSVKPGILSIDNATQHLIGPGTHQMTIHVLNKLTLKQTSQNITIHLMEPLVGLEVRPGSITLAALNNLPVSVTILEWSPVKRQLEQSTVTDYKILMKRPLMRKHRLMRLKRAKKKKKCKDRRKSSEADRNCPPESISTKPPIILSSSHNLIPTVPLTSDYPSQKFTSTGIPTAFISVTESRGVTTIFSSSPKYSITSDLSVTAINDPLDIFIFWMQTHSFEVTEELMANFSFAIKSASDLIKLEQASVLLDHLTSGSNKMTFSVQVKASEVLLSLCTQLLDLKDKGNNSTEKVASAANSLFHTADQLLGVLESKPGATSSTTEMMMKIASGVISSLDKIQTALLTMIKEGDKPIIKQGLKVSMYLSRFALYHLKGSLCFYQRNRSRDLQGSTVSAQGHDHARFTFPSQNALKNVIDPDTVVQVKMLSFQFNPFASFGGRVIQGDVGGLSLLFSNNTEVAVHNLSENIEDIKYMDSTVYQAIPAMRADSNEESLEFLRLFSLEKKIDLFRGNVSKTFVKEYRSSGNRLSVDLNVTSDEDTVVIHINSQENSSLQLFLGFQYVPSEARFQLHTVLPILNANGDRIYTWILTPSMLKHGEGIYYVMVTPSSTSRAGVIFNISAFTTQCLFWTGYKWSSNQCQVGLQSTPHQSHCLCSHLTFFGSTFFVMPNKLDLTQIPELFAQTSQNPAVVSLVASIFGVYIIVLVWARIKDRSDLTKVKVTVLFDNDPLAQYRYLIRVQTGHRKGAATTAKVVIVLRGSEGHSDSHLLTDSEKPVFERGAVDEFLLTTFFSLGELQSIRLWHDNSGRSPAWFVNRVTILDVETGQRWYFICNSWLAIDLDENMADKIFLAASDVELKSFKNLFFMKTAESLTDGHIWFSVVERPPRSFFTRVQRVSCCFSLLLGSMLTNIMFWGTSSDDSTQHALGDFSSFFQEMMIGVESALIMFPINLGIVQIFRSVRNRPNNTKTLDYRRVPRPPSTSFHTPPLTPESLLQDIKRVTSCISQTRMDVSTLEEEVNNANDINQLLVLLANILQIIMEQPNMSENGDATENPMTDLRNQRLEKQQCCLYTLLEQVKENLNLMGVSKFQNPYSQIHAVDQVQKMMRSLQSVPQIKDTTYESNFLDRSAAGVSKELNRVSDHPPTQDFKTTQRCFNGLPWWFVYIAWFLVIVTSATSAFFTILYGLSYGKEKSIKWLISMATTLFQSVFVLQPVKVFCAAAFIALFVRKVDHQHVNEETFHLESEKPNNALPIDRNSKIYQPPTVQFTEQLKEMKRKEKKMYTMIQKILVHLAFLSLLLTIAYGEQNPNSFYFNRAINQTFTPSFSDIRSIDDFYIWANKLLLPTLYGNYNGFIADGYSKLLGSSRIRQLRVQKRECPAILKNIVKICEGPYSFDEEDMSNYGEKWASNISVQASNLSSIWQYQTQLQAYPSWRILALYRGSGYVTDLTTEKENASRIVQYLAESNWIDSYTRAVFVEFTVYNANVNLFGVTTLVLETSGLGTFISSTVLESIQLIQNRETRVLFAAVKIVYMLLVVYYVVLQGKLLREQSWKYFRDQRNLMEVLIILFSWSAFALFLKRLELESKTLDYYRKNPLRFVSFHGLTSINSALNYVFAILVALTTMKLWYLLHLNPKLHLFTSAMRRAWGELRGLFVILVLLLVAYSSVSYVMLRSNISSYSTFFKTVTTILQLQLGHFNYNEVLELYPAAGAVIIATSTLCMTFVVLNLFLSVIMATFTEERHSPIPSEDQEIIDLLSKKLCGFFGIQGSLKSSTQKEAD